MMYKFTQNVFGAKRIYPNISTIHELDSKKLWQMSQSKKNCDRDKLCYYY